MPCYRGEDAVVGTKAPPTAVSVTLIVPYVDVPAASTRRLLPSGCERSSWSCSNAHDCGGTQPGYFGGAGRAKRALSMGTLGCTDSISKIDLPFNQLTVHLNGIFTPATSR